MQEWKTALVCLVVALFLQGDFLDPIDISAVYLHLPFCAGHQRFLRFMARDTHSQFVVLPLAWPPLLGLYLSAGKKTWACPEWPSGCSTPLSRGLCSADGQHVIHDTHSVGLGVLHTGSGSCGTHLCVDPVCAIPHEGSAEKNLVYVGSLDNPSTWTRSPGPFYSLVALVSFVLAGK